MCLNIFSFPLFCLTFLSKLYCTSHCHVTNLKFSLFQMDRLFPPRPTTQLVLRTCARGVPGFPAVLIDLLIRLRYRWCPEYMVYKVYREFNQEQYYADVRIYDQQDDSDL